MFSEFSVFYSTISKFQVLTPQAGTHTTSRHPNATVRLVTRAARRDAGVKVPKTVKSSAKPTARRSALREDALDRNPENAVIW